MARKHSIKKETKTEYNADSGNFSVTETEEHLIVDDTPTAYEAPVSFLDGSDDDDEYLMFLGSKKKRVLHHHNNDDDADAEPALIIRVDDDGFW